MRDPKAIGDEFNGLFKEGEKSSAALVMLAQIAAGVRDHQKRYFKNRNVENLQRSKAWEKLLDESLKRQGIQSPETAGALFE